MGVAVKIGGTFYTVTTPIAYRVGSSGNFETTKRFLFRDPITGTLRDGYTENVPPPDPTDAALSFNSTATGSNNYRSVISWTQNADEDGNEASIEFVRQTTPTSSTDNFTSTDFTTGARSITRNIYGNDDASLTYGSDQVRYAIRTVDEDGEASGYDYTPYRTIPPKLPTAPSITSTGVVSNIPVPTFSWTRTTSNNTVDNYILTISRPNGTTDTQTLAGTVSSYTPTASTGYSGGGTVSFTIKSRSTQNSTTTDSPVTTSSVSYVLPPERPGTLSTSGATNASITYSWGAASGNVDGYYYVIRRYDTSTSYADTTGTTTASSRSVTYSIPNGTYRVIFYVYSTYDGKYSLENRSHSYYPPPPTPSTDTPIYVGGTESVDCNWSYSSTTNLHDQVIYYRARNSDSYTSKDTTATDRYERLTGSYGETFTYYIQAQSESVNINSTARSVLVPPKAPATMIVALASNNSVKFSWTAPDDGVYDGYRLIIYRYDTSTASSAAVDTTYNTSTTSYTYSIPDGTYKVVGVIYSKSGVEQSGGRAATYNVLPPVTSSGSISFTNGTATATWDYDDTTNLHDQRIYYRDDSAESYSYSNLTATDRSFSFSGESGKTASFYIRSYSEYSSRDGETYSGVCPVTTNVSSARFTSGEFVTNWSNSSTNTSYTVYIYRSDGVLIRTESAGNVSSFASGASYYAADSSYYSVIRANNSYGSGYLGSDSGNKKKIANPYIFTPTATYTFFTGFNTASSRWQSNEMRQGVLDAAETSLSYDQELVGFYFYGSAFDAVSSANLGYSLTASNSAMITLRQGDGGSSADRYPYVLGHKYTSVNTALTSVTTYNTSNGSTSTGTAVSASNGGGWSFGEYVNATIPASMGQAIINGYWEGIAFRTGETSAPFGSVSTNYSKWGFYETIFGAGTFYLYHDG